MNDRCFSSPVEAVKALCPDQPLMCFDPNKIRAKVALFRQYFAGQVLYAVKCNTHRAVLQELFLSGIRQFDVASLEEVRMIKGYFPEAECHFMHPVKSRKDLSAVDLEFSVIHYAVDHVNELKKIVELNSSSRKIIWVRLAVTDRKAAYRLNDKFGCQVDQAMVLLDKIVRSGNLPGVTFHVGSQNRDPDSFSQSIDLVGQIVSRSEIPLAYLDIGGGFPSDYQGEEHDLIKYFDAIKQTLTRTKLGKAKLYCEPGRALVADACSLVVQVQLRKENQIYINDGIYHHFMESFMAQFEYPIHSFPAPGKVFSSRRELFTIFGSSCDSFDRLPMEYHLPDNIEEGDWIEFKQMGAYSFLGQETELNWVVIKSP